jgi:DNA repair protein RadC
MGKLFVANSEGGYMEAKDQEILEAAHFAARRRLKKGDLFNSREIAKELLPALLAGKDYEVFCVAFLDAHSRLISFDEMFRGTITQTPVYVREVMKRALDLHAVNLIMVHNHPTGYAKPSKPDMMMTIKMKMAAQLFEIELLDHFIVAGDEVGSMYEDGDMDKGALLKIMLEEIAENFGAEAKIVDMTKKDHNLIDRVRKMMS